MNSVLEEKVNERSQALKKLLGDAVRPLEAVEEHAKSLAEFADKAYQGEDVKEQAAKVVGCAVVLMELLRMMRERKDELEKKLA